MLQKSDVFTEGEEDVDDDNTVNGRDEDDEDEGDDDDPDKSIEFRSEIGSTGKIRFHFIIRLQEWLVSPNETE